MSTVLVVVPSAAHTQAGHPESAARLTAVMELLEQEHALDDLYPIPPALADESQIARVHSPAMIAAVRRAVHQGLSRLDADTYITRASYDAALLAAGSSAAAAAVIMEGQASNGLALIRPPGHHAERARPGGFCLFNNVAVAARRLQSGHGVGRVMVLDFDVHHGNGTQDIFYEDGSVLFVSIHLHGRFFYPGTGGLHEVGQGDGYGATLNVPLPPFVGDAGYARILAELVRPRAQAFQPEMILVSAGFDAHWRDPLAYGGLSLTGYAGLVRQLIDLAGDLCQGRILFVLEGGYRHTALAHGVLNLIHALTGRDLIVDPLGAMPQPEANVTNLLYELQRLHLIK